MRFVPTAVEGALLVVPDPRQDERGSFARLYCEDEFRAAGLAPRFVQANASVNRRRGTLRGLHYQRPPHAEDKFVRCTRGRIFDVAVDLRPQSPTYLKWTGHELGPADAAGLYVPKGCAHGYISLEDDSEVHYLVSAPYAPHAEAGLRWDDPTVGVGWPMPPAFISDKDAALPLWSP